MTGAWVQKRFIRFIWRDHRFAKGQLYASSTSVIKLFQPVPQPIRRLTCHTLQFHRRAPKPQPNVNTYQSLVAGKAKTS